MSNDAYQPELGQAIFGQPTKSFTVQSQTEVALESIRWAVSTFAPAIDDPFGNTGSRYRWSCFQVHAYSWGDDEQQFNFKWRDFEVSWYKYFGRGMSCNRKIKPAELQLMARECLLAVMNEQPAEDHHG